MEWAEEDTSPTWLPTRCQVVTVLREGKGLASTGRPRPLIRSLPEVDDSIQHSRRGTMPRTIIIGTLTSLTRPLCTVSHGIQAASSTHPAAAGGRGNLLDRASAWLGLNPIAGSLNMRPVLGYAGPSLPPGSPYQPPNTNMSHPGRPL